MDKLKGFGVSIRLVPNFCDTLYQFGIHTLAARTGEHISHDHECHSAAPSIVVRSRPLWPAADTLHVRCRAEAQVPARPHRTYSYT